MVPFVHGDSAFPVHLPLSSSDIKTLPQVSCVSWQERDTDSSSRWFIARVMGVALQVKLKVLGIRKAENALHSNVSYWGVCRTCA